MGQQPSKDENGKPRSSLAGCACCARCFSRAGPAAAQQEKRPGASQPLVVEDESWKKWSSYNLIHHPPGGAAATDASKYRPPAFVSLQDSASAAKEAPSRAEAVWEL